MDDLNFPERDRGLAGQWDANGLRLHRGTDDLRHLRHWPDNGHPGATPDPLHLTFSGVRAGTYLPASGCSDGIHYDVEGNLWASAFRLGGILQIDPRGIILGFVPIPNGDVATTNFAFGGPENRDIRPAAPSGASRRHIPA